MARIHYTWNEFDEHVQLLALHIVKVNKKLPTHIYGIPKGGLVLAVALAHRLDTPKVITDFNKIQDVPDFEENVLIVDEICDSGKTLFNFMFKFKRGVRLKTAVIHLREGSIFSPDYKCLILHTKQHVVYPWEGSYNEPRKHFR